MNFPFTAFYPVRTYDRVKQNYPITGYEEVKVLAFVPGFHGDEPHRTASVLAVMERADSSLMSDHVDTLKTKNPMETAKKPTLAAATHR